ncbi:uncharacterized protein BKCO1_1000329 [Diplodia corticola]|uniref:Uncharacterized protein n=1 Tax=Diplodia corticola TaxID=236234 RepID=A0A1J9RJG3_9PEZI|nr:uncharacterized protein BKCO1_1000329 [Diplodia corticola]OJD40800.1 hypothetical protein BKCO1_1000329 [Diplodia corticola]
MHSTTMTSTTMTSTTMASDIKYIYITNLAGGQAIRADPSLFTPDDDDEEPAARPLYAPRNSSISSTSSTSSRFSSAEPSDQE